MSREQLIGTWKLISFKMVSHGEEKWPLGKDCQGILTLDRTGKLVGQLMDPGRRKFAKDTPLLGGTPEEILQAYKGYVAYWASYTVDEAKCMMTSTVEGSLFPNWIGTKQDRYYSFEGNQMTLRTTPLTLGKSDEGVASLTWERIV